MKKAHQQYGRGKRRTGQAGPPEPEPVVIDHFDSGRSLAWYAIQQYDETGLFLSEILADVDHTHALSAQDRGLAVDVASGIIRRRRTLDAILTAQLSRPRANVEPDLWRLLQLGTFQVLFSRAPDHAAVDTTVELARQMDRSRWCGFVNGVLRNVVRLTTEELTPQPATNALPLQQGQYRLLNNSVFADPVTDLVEYVGEAFSLPRVIARRWSQRMSRFDLLKACFHSICVPTTILRVNRLAVTVGQVQTALQEHGVDVEPGQNDWSLKVSHTSRLTSLPGYDQGWWSVQDESALLAGELVSPQPGERILDLCAAPGGKSTHMAELSGDSATIIACDVSESRLPRLEDSVARLKLNNVYPTLIGRDGSDIPPGPYDAVLVDVPCSNTGVLSRRPEARWRFLESDLEELVQLQTRLLLTACEQVKPGGRIVYSTCSIEPEETSLLVKTVTQLVPGLTMIKQQLSLPGNVGDGAFQALLHKDRD
ncbi:MAG: transcription antitermination factor NusB [Planctomycetaceae bacterium]